MSACTRLRDGSVERYHFPLLDPCHEPTCTRRHATMAELGAFDDEDTLPLKVVKP